MTSLALVSSYVTQSTPGELLLCVSSRSYKTVMTYGYQDSDLPIAQAIVFLLVFEYALERRQR